MKAAERKTRRELSAIVRRAADRELSERHDQFSCYALDDAAKGSARYGDAAWKILDCFIPPDCALRAFDEFRLGVERQGARFFWLDFLAEGIENGCIDLDFMQ